MSVEEVRPITLVPVEPIGTSTGPAFVMRRSGCGLENFTRATYPEEQCRAGEKLARFRSDRCDLSLREAANAAGLDAVHVSGLEHGRFAFATDDDAREYVSRLACAAGCICGGMEAQFHKPKGPWVRRDIFCPAHDGHRVVTR